ncbi:RNA methyltransferase [Flammeovirgaceae bacterium SG7u.111]|nr:RNA methyltransferase [Flammeovirgaceae bacterium SG7u.132]WPO34771.1 RNA methyltransferase [Flammeovirgaceae bacterium SG7u.111]
MEKKKLSKELYQFLSEYITEHKRVMFEEISSKRTRHITVVMEDIYQSQNASAVVRTCDCFGIQDVHVIENQNEYVINRDVVRGAANWVDIHKYETADEAISALKGNGYLIAATTPGKASISLDELPIDHKVAVVFGTEQTGISEKVAAAADVSIKIPMFGFTESFNISVSAAICLNHMVTKLHKSNLDWQLSEEEIWDLKADWAEKTIKKGEIMVKEFYNKYNK